MKRVEIFFGEMGSGKSYAASRRATSTGLRFIEGDLFASPEMIVRVQAFKPLDRKMIVDLVERLTSQVISVMELPGPGVALSQALYFDEDRLNIDSALKMAGFNVVWYWIKPSFLRNVKQLLKRPRGWRWVLYWLMNKPFFQKPTHSYIGI